MLRFDTDNLEMGSLILQQTAGSESLAPHGTCLNTCNSSNGSVDSSSDNMWTSDYHPIWCDWNTEACWLVVWTPLKNMKVNWDDDIPNIWENRIDVPNHQPACTSDCWGSQLKKNWSTKPASPAMPAVVVARPWRLKIQSWWVSVVHTHNRNCQSRRICIYIYSLHIYIYT